MSSLAQLKRQSIIWTNANLLSIESQKQTWMKFESKYDRFQSG